MQGFNHLDSTIFVIREFQQGFTTDFPQIYQPFTNDLPKIYKK